MLIRLSKREIQKILKERELEDPSLIREIESLLEKKRGYIFKMPTPKTPVILLFSGGLDTTITAAIIMEEFGLEIYPVFTRRGHPYQYAEERAVKFFTSYFQKRYPGLFHNPIKVGAYFPPKEIRWAYEKVENKPFKKGSKQIWGDFFYSDLLCTYAAQCAYYLQIIKNLHVRTIFTAYMRSDGEAKIDMTLTTLRGVMLGICMVTHDFDWQITSIPLEKELGFFYDKDYFIRWAYERGIPLEKTRSSCRSKLSVHCGSCLLCSVRREAFKKAGVPDRTLYVNDLLSIANNMYWNFGKKIVPKSLRRPLKKVLGIGRK